MENDINVLSQMSAEVDSASIIHRDIILFLEAKMSRVLFSTGNSGHSFHMANSVANTLQTNTKHTNQVMFFDISKLLIRAKQ